MPEGQLLSCLPFDQLQCTIVLDVCVPVPVDATAIHGTLIEYALEPEKATHIT